MSRGASIVALAATVVALALLMALPAGALADFGFVPGPTGFSGELLEGDGPATVSGAHPTSFVADLNLNKSGGGSPEGSLRDLSIDLPAGMIENPTTVPFCGLGAFGTARVSPFEGSASGESCSGLSQVGIVTVRSARGGGETRTFGVFNFAPPAGAISALGFSPWGVPIIVTPHIREANREYGITLDLNDFPRQLQVTGLRLELWGTPWASIHADQRGNCLNETEPSFGWAKCPVSDLNPSHETEAYLTSPTDCTPLIFAAGATSWEGAGPVGASATGPALGHCEELKFAPIPGARLTTERANSQTGFEFTLDGIADSLNSPSARAASQAKKAVVSLPEGMTVNPSVAAGLGTCSEAQYASETPSSPAGAGCPNDSKIGELKIQTPLFEETIEGSMYFATPRENPFGTLLALYLVAKVPNRGLMIRVAGRVDSDPATGRLTAIFDDLPQFPYTHFEVHFREGQRSPLASPPTCGNYSIGIDTTAWRDTATELHQTWPFNITSGIGGGPCPKGLPPFTPAAVGGTLNSNAGAYSPFYLHLSRTDDQQEITSYSATLPPGLLGKIAGVPFCPEAAIEAAKRQTGAESAVAPACPAASRIGRTYTGYGLGQTLAYAPGGLYLAGPYHGSPLSVVAIDSAKVGPFDLGTVVIRSAIRVDPKTAQVAIDSAGSDPIPHILDGFPLKLRDIRIYIDRPNFMVNPTNCNPFSVTSVLTGSGVRYGDSSDDPSATAVSPFQVSNCSALGFSPHISLTLRGGHRRGDFPALRAVVRPREADSNIAAATVTLPPKLFLAQEHLGTVCTPRQFAAQACPKGSVYGNASAVTPLLEEPLTGPVILRSNGNERRLPDLVATLHGRGVQIELLGKIDSFRGGLRARFEGLPDAPVTSFTMNLLGGKKGIIANATNTCTNPQVANAKFIGQENGLQESLVRMKVKCGKAGKGTKKPKHKAKNKGGKR